MPKTLTMAKLTLVELTNVSQFFGQSEYAMFLATTQENQLIECGITHNSLTRKGFDVDNLDSLVGCQVITKEYTDNRTGELINPEDRIQMIIDGDARLVLFNAINSTIKKSEVYMAEQLQLVAATNAKMKNEIAEKKKLEQKQKAQERLLAKILALKTATGVQTKPASLDDDEDETVPTAEPVSELQLNDEEPF